jgi:hypothetical protein
VGWASALGLIALTTVGYSSGATFGSRQRRTSPAAWDLVLLMVLWAAALAARAQLGHWPGLGLSVLVAFVIAALVSPLRSTEVGVRIPAHVNSSPLAPPGLLRLTWVRWKAFSLRMGNFQGRLLMALLYFGLVTPVAAFVRLLSDPLRLRHQALPTFWEPRTETRSLPDAARSQF